ncbi:MAG: radical SAM protein [Desulfovibrio sp.]|nr:radical SAM protein [Desulfovibrio sp.]MBI4959175.1 radical SAM protein [Desulfovibrio sp.]
MRKQKLEQYALFFRANNHIMVDNVDEADCCLVWTCGFRSDFRDACLLALDAVLAKCPGETIISGCLPDICPELLPRTPRSRIVAWRDDAEVLEGLFGQDAALDSFSPIFAEPRKCEDTAAFRKLHPGADVTFHDQFIKLVISEGCLFDCTYCSEKLAFPPFRSFPLDGLLSAAKDMMEQTGVYDLILMADSLGQYGLDIGETFPGLLNALCALDARVGIALNNLNPANFAAQIDDMSELIRQGRLRHLNLPIQSASDRILKLMNRAYNQRDLHLIYERLASLGFTAHDTHLIAGFPGETAEDFQKSIDFILCHRPRYVLLSQYMESQAAPSARLGNKVDASTVRSRLQAAEAAFAKAGIICNCDDSELSRQRLVTLFLNKS